MFVSQMLNILVYLTCMVLKCVKHVDILPVQREKINKDARGWQRGKGREDSNDWESEREQGC